MKTNRLLTITALLLLILTGRVFSEDLTIIRVDNFLTVSPRNGKILYRDSENRTAVIKSINGAAADVSLSPLEFWPIHDSLFSENAEKLYIVAGGRSANNPKSIIEYDTVTGQPNWSFKIGGDFVSSLSLTDDTRLLVSLHNIGAVLNLDLVQMASGGAKIYDFQCYYVEALNSGSILVYGCDNYQEGKHSVKYLNAALEVENSVSFPSGEYTINYSREEDQFIAWSHNSYLAPDSSISIYNSRFEKTGTIPLDNEPRFASYSEDGRQIIAALGYQTSSRIGIYNPDGELVKEIPVETDDEFVRIAAVYGTPDNLFVRLGRSER